MPTVHILPKVTEEMLLKDLEWKYKDERDWENFLHKWSTKHLEPAKARLSLLRQKEYDQIGHFSQAFSTGKYEMEEMKKWEKAILHGLSVDKLEEFERQRRERERQERKLLAERRRLEREEADREALEGAIRIQHLWRRRQARMRIKMMLMDRYEKVYAPEQQGYYYYDKVKQTTSWEAPHIFRLFHVELEGVY